MSLHPAVEKERFGGFCSQFPYNDDSQHCDVHRTPQQSFRRTRARACRRARAGQGNDAEGTIGFACRSRHRRMQGTNPLRLYCALVWWRPGRVRTQEETFQGSHNPSSQFMPYAKDQLMKYHTLAARPHNARPMHDWLGISIRVMHTKVHHLLSMVGTGASPTGPKILASQVVEHGRGCVRVCRCGSVVGVI